MSGTGVKSDRNIAMDNFAKAANAGFKEAQFIMGALLLQSDEKEALRWLVNAHSSGCAGAAGILATMYIKKGGSYEKAGWEWAKKAAAEGDAMSQLMLGNHLREISKTEAYAWLKTALTEHSPNPSFVSAEFSLKALEKGMDVDTLKKSRALAETYRGKYGKTHYSFCSQSMPSFAGPLEYDH
jgi:TPR repeat protein